MWVLSQDEGNLVKTENVNTDIEFEDLKKAEIPKEVLNDLCLTIGKSIAELFLENKEIVSTVIAIVEEDWKWNTKQEEC